MRASETDRLFGAVVLLKGFVHEPHFRAMLDAWTLSPQVSLGEIMVRRRLITAKELEGYRAIFRQKAIEEGLPEEEFIGQRLQVVLGELLPRIEDVAISDFLQSGKLSPLPAGSPHSPSSSTPIGSPLSPDSTILSADGSPSIGSQPLTTVQTTIRYQLDHKQGQGGLGEVWSSNDPILNRRVAVKRIRTTLDSEAARWRFLQEARVTGNLQHPHIVPVYGLGTEANDLFYSMRLIDGQTLKEHIEQLCTDPERSLSTRAGLTRFLEMFLKIAQAIAYAHARGVIHRDLKPENVMVGRFGEVVVLDWGLAKLTGNTPSEESEFLPLRAEQLATEGLDQLTQAGMILGSPLYMAPEQAQGHVDDIDARTDVYGLGGILYHALTLKPPHSPATLATPREHIERICEENVPSVRESHSYVPRPVAAIVAKCLARNPDERYPTAEALIRDVELFVAGDQVSVYEEPWHERLFRWGKRHRVVVSSLFVTLVLSIVVLSILSTLAWQGRSISFDTQRNQLHHMLSESTNQVATALRWIPTGLQFLSDTLPLLIQSTEPQAAKVTGLSQQQALQKSLEAYLETDVDYWDVFYFRAEDLQRPFASATRSLPDWKVVNDPSLLKRPPNRGLLERALAKPSLVHYGNFDVIREDAEDWIMLSVAIAIRVHDKPHGVVVVHLVIDEDNFGGLISVAKSDTTFTYVFDEDGTVLIYIAPDNQIAFETPGTMDTIFPDINLAISEQLRLLHGGAPSLVREDGGILLAQQVSFDTENPNRRLTVVFGKSAEEIYATFNSISQRVRMMGLLAMGLALALFVIVLLILFSPRRR